MKSIRDIAAARILRSRCSVMTLRKYLKQKSFEIEDIDSIISDFLEYGYLDDLEYSKDFISYGENKGWGKSRIQNELRKRGIRAELINEAYETCMDELEKDANTGEYDRAFGVALKIIRQSGVDCEQKLPEKVRNRIIRRLSSYGYGASIVFSVLRNIDEMTDYELFE